MLPNEKAILLIRGEKPVVDLKYDILKHPNVKYTADGNAEFYEHGVVDRATGTIDCDDEVAVILDDESLEALSVPLISMRYLFNEAVCENIITESEKDDLIEIAKATFYPKRNYASTLSESKLDNAKKDRLINFIRESEDIKKQDAKLLIRHIKSLLK